MNWEENMSNTIGGSRVVVGVALAAIPLMMASIASAQAPAAPPPPAPLMPPSLVPSLSVDLMTAEGFAAFGAVWKTAEARVVELSPWPAACPATTRLLDMQPHAGEANFDDSKWQTIEAKGLGDRRGGGKTLVPVVPNNPHRAGKDREFRHRRPPRRC